MIEYLHSIFYIHLFSTLFMTGLIWVIQILHYPSYDFIDGNKFTDYQQFHTTRITYIVGPMMLIEVFTGVYLTVVNDWALLFTLNFLGLGVIWLTTLVFSIPSHNKLSLGFNPGAVSYLIKTNWIRTLTWTARSCLLTYFLIRLSF